MGDCRRPKPNVVLCLCDQLRAFEVGAYGNGVIRTPNLDRMASSGVRFEIACSNSPLCTPARSVLISGQYNRSCTGTMQNVGEPIGSRQCLPEPTLAEVLREAGYTTGLIGKWHIGPEPRLAGFDYALYPRFTHRYTGQTYIEDGKEFVVREFAPDFEAWKLRQYVAQHRDEPFFLFHNIAQPHMPLLDAPARYRALYPRDAVPLRPNVFRDGKPAYDENWFKIYLWDYLYYRDHLPHTAKLPDGFDLRDLAALYYAMTTCTDDQVGTLMAALESNGLADNTLVVFVSDHGDNLGSHHRFNKQLLIEESIRVPLLFQWPGRLAPRVVAGQVASLVDVMPTVLSLLQIPAPEKTQGTDLAAVLRGEVATAGENAAYVETSENLLGVRTATHLYGFEMAGDWTNGAWRPLDASHQFFDLRDDPYELNNLAGSGRQAELAGELRTRLLRWNSATPWLKLP